VPVAAALLAWACVAPESGNSATRCDDDTACGRERYRALSPAASDAAALEARVNALPR
jgi:hypothetical protein